MALYELLEVVHLTAFDITYLSLAWEKRFGIRLYWCLQLRKLVSKVLIYTIIFECMALCVVLKSSIICRTLVERCQTIMLCDFVLRRDLKTFFY